MNLTESSARARGDGASGARPFDSTPDVDERPGGPSADWQRDMELLTHGLGRGYSYSGDSA